MKTLKLFEEFIFESETDKSFEHKGYFCSIIKIPRFQDGWTCLVYKGDKSDPKNYVMGIKNY